MLIPVYVIILVSYLAASRWSHALSDSSLHGNQIEMCMDLDGITIYACSDSIWDLSYIMRRVPAVNGCHRQVQPRRLSISFAGGAVGF